MEGHINERIRTLQGQELYDYLAECAPYIKDHSTGTMKRDVYTDYLLNVEGVLGTSQKVKDDFRCKRCGSTRFIHDHTQSDDICTECGTVAYITGSDVGYKEEQDMDKVQIYSYDRKNHFNEWIAQFQGKETTTIPKEVLETLKEEFRKQKIKTNTEITHSKVRTLLKKVGMTKYYEHAPYIATVLNGLTPPAMPQGLEDRLRLMFNQIQMPFNKNCPAERKNFLSYSYVLYKFCEILGEDHYLPYFPLLKSKEKLYKQDQIWALICKDLAWEFIRTV